MKLRKSPFLIAILLEIMILMSTILLSHNNTSAQTYVSITKKREIFKNNPQIPLGLGAGLINSACKRCQISSSAGIPLTVDPSTNKVYVANAGSNTVSIIDSDSGNVTNIPVGTSPRAIAVSPSTNKIYVANELSNDVSVISATDKEITRIPVGARPIYIIVSSASGGGEKIYVANFGSNDVSVISASTNKEIARIPVGAGPSGIVVADTYTETDFYSPYKIYVANEFSNDVSVINASTDKEITRIPIIEHSVFPVGTSPGIPPMVINYFLPLGSIYVPSSFFNDVYVISAEWDKVVSRIHVGTTPAAIAVNPSSNGYQGAGIPSGNRSYVANFNSNNVSVISGYPHKEISRIPVGEQPNDIEVSKVYPSIIYVLNTPQNQSSTISVIDGICIHRRIKVVLYL